MNVESFKNKNMHFFCKIKRWFDIQNLILRATAEVIDLANDCLEGGNKNRLMQSKDVVIQSVDILHRKSTNNNPMQRSIEKILTQQIKK